MQTVRQIIADLLNDGPVNAREISQKVGIREREVAVHLSHIARTLKARGKKLVIRPAECLLCGYVFKERKRLTQPGSCPFCKRSHIRRPKFCID